MYLTYINIKIKAYPHKDYNMITENKDFKEGFYFSRALVSSIFTYSLVMAWQQACSEQICNC